MKYRKKEARKHNHKGNRIVIGLIFLITILLAGCTRITVDDSKVDNKIENTATITVTAPEPTEIKEQAAITQTPINIPDTTTAQPKPKDSGNNDGIEDDAELIIHFLDVGQADAAIVECDGKVMMIDGGNAADSSFIYSYLQQHGITTIDYMIATHAHEDHIGGLSGALNYATVENVYCPTTEYDTKTFQSFKKYVGQEGKEIKIPNVGEQFQLGNAVVEVIGVLPGAEDVNNTSIVVMITYKDTKFLFTGDAERDAEQALLEKEYDLKCNVLKVGHHGSSSSTTYPFLREVLPDYAIISVGKDNDYGHPSETTISRLADAEVTVFRTDEQGTITCISDGKTITITTEKEVNKAHPTSEPIKISEPTQAPTPTEPTKKGTKYVLNTNTKKFHYSSCSSAKKIKDSNKEVYEGTREDLTDMGYSPCGNCKP